jgi:hypothetical protein
MMPPVAVRCARRNLADARIRLPSGPANMVTTRSADVFSVTETAPRARNWANTWPASRLTNWGMKDRKNRAVFGLRTSVAIPCQKGLRAAVVLRREVHRLRAMLPTSSVLRENKGRRHPRISRSRTRPPNGPAPPRLPRLPPARAPFLLQRCRGRTRLLRGVHRQGSVPVRTTCRAPERRPEARQR